MWHKSIIYSGVQAKLCTTLLALAWLISLSACSNAYDTNLGSHTHDVLPIAATETIVYGHRTSENTKEYQTFFFKQKFVFYGLLWPFTLILVAPIGNTSWVCDPRWVSYALEQAERLKSGARAKKVMHLYIYHLQCYTILIIFFNLSLNPLENWTKLRPDKYWNNIYT